MGPFPYAALEDVLKESEGAAGPRIFLLLDAIRDPHNFGAIIRSAAALGASAVVIGEEGQAPVNNHVARASAGALNRIPIVQVPEIGQAPPILKARGIRIVAANHRASTPAWEYDFSKDACLVLGNEGSGIGDDMLRLCDDEIAIPGVAEIDSLNVAAAATAILYEARRSRCSLDATQ